MTKYSSKRHKSLESWTSIRARWLKRFSIYGKNRSNITYSPKRHKSLESWIQTLDDTGGYWANENDEVNCPQCYNEELISEYLVDMEFYALGRDGTQIANTLDNTEFGRADPMLDKDTIFDIRSVDVRLTFRSSAAKGFYRSLKTSTSVTDEGTTTTTTIPRIVKSLGARTIAYFDKYLRDSVVVTIHTRNIGELY